MNTTKEKFNNLYNNNFALFITLFIIIVIVLICVIIGFSKLTNSIRRNESFIPAPSFKKGTA